MRLTLFGVLLSAIVFFGSLSGQSTTDLSKAPLTDEGKPRHVSGRVIDDLSGKPISGAEVQLSIIAPHGSCPNCSIPSKPSNEPQPPREMMSGEDGSFTFDNVPRRMINVTARKDGYLTSWPIRRRAKDTLGNYANFNDSVESIVIRLAPEATISGLLRHHDGSPVTVHPRIDNMHVRSWAGCRIHVHVIENRATARL
jgi:hypothetical protein